MKETEKNSSVYRKRFEQIYLFFAELPFLTYVFRQCILHPSKGIILENKETSFETVAGTCSVI